MALMGGSGAGKTTLADVLCGRKTVGEVQGDIFVNGYPKDQVRGGWVVGGTNRLCARRIGAAYRTARHQAHTPNNPPTKRAQASWARVVGYVEQQDIHTAATTVAETLWFSARLRLPPSVSDTWIGAYVIEVLDLVELTPLANSLVGDPAGPGGGTGLSTEQRKRLTIVVELVANPSVVFMDEPTSGARACAGCCSGQCLLCRVLHHQQCSE